jgi:hypothetical protein
MPMWIRDQSCSTFGRWAWSVVFLFPLFLSFSLQAQEAKPATNEVASDPVAWLLPIPEDSSIKRGKQGAYFERWNDIPGNKVADLRTAPEFNLGPSVVGILPGLSTPTNDGVNFGVRLRAWIVAPRSGDVRFAVTSDDNSEFWISPTENCFGRRLEAWVAGDGWFGWSMKDRPDRIASQWTRPIPMKEGKSYYIEVWHKESNNDDHLSVLWQWKDDLEPVPVPASALIPYFPDPNDKNDNGLPDDWEARTGLSERDQTDAWQDTDGDGVSNFNEFVAQANPLDGGSSDGFLRWEVWFGIAGGEVADLTGSPRFELDPDRSELLATSASPTLAASNFGSRLSGFLVPGQDDDYEFALAGDDAAELWLSSDDDPENRQRVAFNDVWRAEGRWDAVPAQVTSPIRLLAGRSYYIEVLHKDHHAPGRFELGWRPSGTKEFSLIPSKHLRSPNDNSESRKRGHMNKDWMADHRERSRQAGGSDVPALSPYGNPSGDGIPNWIKAKLDLDPFSRAVRQGGLTRQWWFGLPGSSLDSAREKGWLLRRPSMMSMTEAAVAEANTTDHFLSRIRGTVLFPETGTYRFWIAGDDYCELWLSDDDNKFRKRLIAQVGPGEFELPGSPAWTEPQEWDRRSNQKSGVFQVTAGTRRFIEILHKDGNGDDHVSVAWQVKLPGQDRWSARQVIPAEQLFSHAGEDDDLDDDYLPDSWEQKFKLDPKDNGLFNKQQGELGDFDGDSLTNHAEYLIGTNPSKSDTDGDGVSDADEINLFRSNPLTKDVSPPVEHHRFSLESGVSVGAPWMFDPSGGLSSGSRRGAVSFELELDRPGIYSLVLHASATGSISYVPPVPVVVSINDTPLGTAKFPVDSATSSWLTPWLPAGKHLVKVDSHNVRANVSLTIHSVTLMRFEGNDSAGFGVPDWLGKFLHERSSASQLSPTSRVSPWFVEGVSRFPESVSIAVEDLQVPAKDHLTGQWYANVPLPSDGSVANVVFSLEGGSVMQSHKVQWVTTNLVEMPPINHLRVGDSIRAVAFHSPDDTFSLKLGAERWSDQRTTSPVTLTFDKPGIHQLEVVLSDGTRLERTFQIHQADFGEPFSLSVGAARNWVLPLVNHPLEITVDSGINSTYESDVFSEEGPVSLLLENSSAMVGSRSIIARLPGGGPIVATGSIHSFALASATRTGDSYLVGTLPDGTRIVEVSYIIDGEVPADLSLWIRLYVTDAVFANGLTWLLLTAADFDENGVARFRVLKAPGSGVPYVCHWILPYASFEEVMRLRPPGQ